tara:strand:+ start:718 stop:1023 length:306 start_codon:yes stop_codon:yes gene_type:complete
VGILFIILIGCVIMAHMNYKNTNYVINNKVIEGLTEDCDHTKGKYNHVRDKIETLKKQLEYSPMIKTLNSIRAKVKQSSLLATNIKKQVNACKKKQREQAS